MIYAIVLLVPIYVVWCFYSAYQARGRVAPKLDALLSRSDIDDELKHTLVAMYQDSFKQFISVRILLGAWFGGRTKVHSVREIEVEGATSLLEAIKVLDEETRNEYVVMIFSLCMVNVRFAPITNILSVIIFVVSLVLRIILGYSAGQYLKDKLHNAEMSYRSHVVH